MTVLIILAGISALATLGVLFAGVATMGKGDTEGKKRGNRLMQMRVGLQALTIFLLFLIAVVASQG